MTALIALLNLRKLCCQRRKGIYQVYNNNNNQSLIPLVVETKKKMDGEQKDDERNNSNSSNNGFESQNKIQKACLPEEIMFDILIRVPARYLMSSARYICKSWSDMISKSQFLDAQFLHAKPGIFVQSTTHPYVARFLEFKDNGEFEVTDFSPDLPGRFLMSSCGLSLLCQYPSRDLHVANLVTLKSVALPLTSWGVL